MSLNEVQHESNQFGVLSLQKHIDDIDMQISAFVRNSVLSFSPDVIGDLLFNGVTPFARRSDLAEGVQADASWRINDSHTLRGGFLGQVETTAFDTTSSVLPVDATGAQTSIVPVNIIDNGARTGGLYGVYLQDEWRILPALTLNSGLRFDGVNEFTNETQVSPRVNVVMKATDDDDGSCRLFALFRATALRTRRAYRNRALQQHDERLLPFSRTTSSGRSGRIISMSGSIRSSFLASPSGSMAITSWRRNLIDEGQFGAPIILTAFNYAKGLCRRRGYSP